MGIYGCDTTQYYNLVLHNQNAIIYKHTYRHPTNGGRKLRSKNGGQKMKIAIIGCGKIANDEHIPAYLTNEEAEIRDLRFFIGDVRGYVFVVSNFPAAYYCYFHFLPPLVDWID